MKDNFL